MIEAQLKLRMALIELGMELVYVWFGRFNWGGRLYQRLGEALWSTQRDLDNQWRRFVGYEDEKEE